MTSPDESYGIVSTLEAYPDHVRAIGMISIEIANLDLELGALLGAMLRVSAKLGQVVYLTPRTAMGRIHVLENVTDQVFKPTSPGLKKLKTLFKQAKKLIGKRHDMIHEAWGVAKDDPKSVRRVTLPPTGAESKPVPLTELNSLVRSIRILIFDVRRQKESIIASLPKAAYRKSRKPKS